MTVVHESPDATRPDAALLYRLCGDGNRLHIDPGFAQRAGFPRPILHGLATLGVVTHALLRGLAGYDTTHFKSLDLRFSAPVYPGETIRTEMWIDGKNVSFRARVAERDVGQRQHAVEEQPGAQLARVRRRAPPPAAAMSP